MLFFSLVKKLDYFGPTVQFTIRRESNFKTFFGGLVSMISFSLYLLFLYSFGQDLINYENPNVFSQTNYLRVWEEQAFQINNENMFFTFILKKNELIYKGLKPEDLTFKAYFNTIANITQLGKPVTKELKIVNCSDFLKETGIFSGETTFFNQKIKEHSCLYFPKEEEYFVQGSPFVFPYKSVSVKVLLKPNNNTCKIFKDLQNLPDDESWIQIPFQFLQTNFQPKKYTKPFQDTLSGFSHAFSIKSSSIARTELEHHLLQDDDGFFFPNEKRISRFSCYQTSNSLSNIEFDYKSFENHCKNKDEAYLRSEKNTLLEVRMDLNLNRNQEHFRTYKKIQDVLGNVNGVMDIIDKLFIIVISIYSSYRLDYFMINSNLNVRGENADNKNDNESKDKGKKIPRFDNDIADLKAKRHRSTLGVRPKNIEMQRKNNKSDLLNAEVDHKNSGLDMIKEKENENENNGDNNKISYTNDKKNDISGFMKKSNTIEDLELKFKDNKSNRNANSINEYSNAEASKIVKNISKYMEPKKSFLKPNIFYYFFCCHQVCGKDKNRRLHLQILSNFTEKITSKLDIMYYFKLIKKIKNLQICLFSEPEQSMFFDILSKDLYPIKEKTIMDDKFFEKEKYDKKKILIDYYQNVENNNFYSDEIMNDVFPSLLELSV